MATFTHQCPHCLTEHIALRIVAARDFSQWHGVLHLSCPKCRMPSAALIEIKRTDYGAQVSQWMGIEADVAAVVHIRGFWPAPPAPLIPEHLPNAIECALFQAEHNFPVVGNEEAAGTMYRKALDLGLKALAPDVDGNLKKRIDKMVETHLLTPALGMWAHEIRLLGNDSAHDEEPPTRDELTALRNFTNLVMQYLFTLPKMVELRKATPTENK